MGKAANDDSLLLFRTRIDAAIKLDAALRHLKEARDALVDKRTAGVYNPVNVLKMARKSLTSAIRILEKEKPE